MNEKKPTLDYERPTPRPRWRDSPAGEMVYTLLSMIGVVIFCTAAILIARFGCVRP